MAAKRIIGSNTHELKLQLDGQELLDRVELMTAMILSARAEDTRRWDSLVEGMGRIELRQHLATITKMYVQSVADREVVHEAALRKGL